MDLMFKSPYIKLLVFWVGVYQVGHLLLNTLILAGNISLNTFPPPPPENWSSQSLSVLCGLALSDAISAGLSLIFVAGYLVQRPWSLWFGIVALGTNLFAVIPFTFLTVGAGAWHRHSVIYVGIYLATIPLLLLFIALSLGFFRAARGSNGH